MLIKHDQFVTNLFWVVKHIMFFFSYINIVIIHHYIEL